MLKLDTGGRLDKGLGRGSRPPEEVRFAIDSALEGDGFELSVPGRESVNIMESGLLSRKRGGSVGERRFESISLQRRVRKLSVPLAPILRGERVRARAKCASSLASAFGSERGQHARYRRFAARIAPLTGLGQ
jgi:hypothetical protein